MEPIRALRVPPRWQSTKGPAIHQAIREAPGSRNTQAATWAYRALVVFSFLYYTRPEDAIPGMAVVPVEKIAGGIALIALIAGFASRRMKTRLPLEIKILLLLFADLCLTIPFAYWRMGALSYVLGRFSKGVIVALLVALVVESMAQLRTLILVQAAAVATITCVSLIFHPGAGRLQGVLGGVYENPNDLAINIAINWPLCLALLIASRGPIKKALWTLGLIAMLYGLFATFSRSGFIAMGVALWLCFWAYGVRGKRLGVLVLTGCLGIGGLGVALSIPHYFSRLESIVQGPVAGAEDRGSWEARRELFGESLQIALHHPILGIGPGNFPAVTETWHDTHNTYTEFAAEAGFPALLLFLAMLTVAFRHLYSARKRSRHGGEEEIELFASAIWASLAAYLVGAFFSSTEYNLFPYFMVAYASALYRIAVGSEQTDDLKPAASSLASRWRGVQKQIAPAAR